MAYMRGENYLWNDRTHLHVWVADGYDHWDEASWHLVEDGDSYPVDPEHLKDGVNTASGVKISQDIMDEYVVMRLSQLIEEKLLEDAINRALTKWPRRSLQRYAKEINGLIKNSTE